MIDQNNPRAFPSAAIDDRYGGMELRDWLAWMALSGLIARMSTKTYENCVDEDDWSFEAGDAYDIADAMMAERAKRDETDQANALPAAAKSLHDAGYLTTADYHRTLNRIDATERVRKDGGQ